MLFFPPKGGDRDSLTLKSQDEALIQAVADANPNTVVVMMGGSAVITESWREQVPAILMAWYPGMQGGHALADILFGKVNPSGKLPCVFPKSVDQLPFFNKDADSIEYGCFHGYRLLDRDGNEPAFPFGFGLSYTTFSYQNLCIELSELTPAETLTATVEVTNTGPVAGEEVVQLYIGYENSQVERPVKELKGFDRLELQPGETKLVVFDIPARQLAYYDESKSGWVVEPITYHLYVGASSAPGDLLHEQFNISK